MKVRTRGIPGDLTGKVDDLVLYRNKRGNKLFARKHGVFTDHPGQAPFRSAQQAIYALQPSEGYKRNLREYLHGYDMCQSRRGSILHFHRAPYPVVYGSEMALSSYRYS